MAEVLAAVIVVTATTLGAAEICAPWSPLALRFKWSLGWLAARSALVAAAVALALLHFSP